MKLRITCKGQKYVTLGELKPFQGGLKTVSQDDIERAKRSILRHGFSFPFLVWGRWILDGHQRLAAVKELLKEGHTIGPVPCVEIEASGRAEAAEKLLLINSRYGRITETGLAEFLSQNNLDLSEIIGGIELADVDIKEFLGAGIDIEALNNGTGSAGKREGAEKEGYPNSPEGEKNSPIKSFPAFLGSFCLHQAKADSFKELKEWKKNPAKGIEFEQRMISDFTAALKRRSNHFGFVTVPPPNAKRVNGYDGYPIAAVAQAVAKNIGVPFLEVFEHRTVKTRHGVMARTHQEQAGFVLKNIEQFKKFGACLLLDDVSTTRWTVAECQRVLSTVNICTLALVFCYWGNV
jgi:hypothetical protein